MIESLGFLAGQRQNLLDPRSVGNVPDHLRFRTGTDLLFDFHADGLEIEPHLLQNIDGHALSELDQAKQQMLGADVIVIKSIGLFSSECQDLLCARSKIIHRSMEKQWHRCPTPSPDY